MNLLIVGDRDTIEHGDGMTDSLIDVMVRQGLCRTTSPIHEAGCGDRWSTISGPPSDAPSCRASGS